MGHHLLVLCFGMQARAGELVNVLREAGQTVPEELLKFGTHVKKKVRRAPSFVLFYQFVICLR